MLDMNEVIAFAEKAHEGHYRKYTNEPYTVHLAEVADLVQRAGGSDEMVAAAWLHDTVEDTSVTFAQIRERFGQKVETLVYYLTDISTPDMGNRAARKQIDRLHIADGSPQSKTIKLADLISNTRSITQYDPYFAKVYMREKQLLLPYLVEGNESLYKMARLLLETYYGGPLDE